MSSYLEEGSNGSGMYLWLYCICSCWWRRGSYWIGTVKSAGGGGPSSWRGMLAVTVRLLRARFRLLTFRRTQHWTDRSSVHTMAVRQPMYTSTIRSPPRFCPRSTLPAITNDIPVRTPAINSTCKPNRITQL